MSEDHPIHPKVEEHDRRIGQTNKILHSRRESLGEAHGHGLEALLDTMEQNGVDDPDVSDIRRDHFQDENFRQVYRDAVVSKLADKAADYVNADSSSLDSFEGSELFNLYTNETQRTVNQTIQGFLSQLNTVDEFTSGNLETFLYENLENFDNTRQRAQQWTIDHFEPNDTEDLIEYGGVDDIYRANGTPLPLAASIAQQSYTGNPIQEDEAVTRALQYNEGAGLDLGGISDDELRTQIEGLGSGQTITDLYQR